MYIKWLKTSAKTHDPCSACKGSKFTYTFIDKLPKTK